jgi:5'-3' exonuclease
VLAAGGWPVISIFRKEADDILASAAMQFDGEVDVLTGDRDLLAVCSDRVNILLFAPASTIPQRCGPLECEEIFGIAPYQVCEWKALAGDASDGIPGVSGIGPRGASTILRRYGTLREAFADDTPGKISPKLRSTLSSNRDAAAVSWKVAKLDTQLPVAGRWRELNLCFGVAGADAVERLGFGTLSRHFARAPRGTAPPIPA